MIQARSTINLSGFPTGEVRTVDEDDPYIAGLLDSTVLVPVRVDADPPLFVGVDAEAHTRDELAGIAKDRGVEVTTSMTKAEIADAINADE